MYFTSVVCISMKLRENWRKEIAHLPAPARYAGFTLIELSIVLVVIGLLVGGVLVGQDLMRAAEVRSTISMTGELTASYYTFRTKYNAIAGDMRNATSFWGESSTTQCYNAVRGGTETCDGNGNGFYDKDIYTTEPLWALQHLENARLIKQSIRGGNINDDPLPDDLYIKTAIKKVFLGFWHQEGTTGYFPRKRPGKLYFILGGGMGEDGYPYAIGMLPSTALDIDTKIDDGVATTGQVGPVEDFDTTCVEGDTNHFLSDDPIGANYDIDNPECRLALIIMVPNQ